MGQWPNSNSKFKSRKILIKHYSCLIGFITYHAVDALSDFIWTDINWTLAALAFILMSVQIKSDKMAKLNTYNECIRPFISMSAQSYFRSRNIRLNNIR